MEKGEGKKRRRGERVMGSYSSTNFALSQSKGNPSTHQQIIKSTPIDMPLLANH
jgi:hypothetical protein